MCEIDYLRLNSTATSGNLRQPQTTADNLGQSQTTSGNLRQSQTIADNRRQPATSNQYIGKSFVAAACDSYEPKDQGRSCPGSRTSTICKNVNGCGSRRAVNIRERRGQGKRPRHELNPTLADRTPVGSDPQDHKYRWYLGMKTTIFRAFLHCMKTAL